MESAEPVAADEAQRQNVYEAAAIRLREQVPNILRTWEARVRRQAPVARNLDQVTLYNNLHVVLAEIAEVLAVGVDRDAYSYARIPTAHEHAQQRAGLDGFTLDAITLEYHLLRRAVVEVMEEEEPLPCDVGRVLHDGIDRAMQEAAIYFVAENERMRAEAEEERRALTQQCPLLREPVRSGAPPTRGRTATAAALARGLIGAEHHLVRYPV